MQSPVQLEPDTGGVRVGVRRYPCVFTAGGLVVLDRRIRAMSLEERAVAVALSGSGNGRESRMSALVADMATEPESWAAGLDEDERATIEAIALHLAGASGTGSLATTMVLACRALGWPTNEPLAMTALLADELATSVSAAGSNNESGWIALVLEGSEADPSAMSVFEARDHLAHRLAQRADEPPDIGSTEDSAEQPMHIASRSDEGDVAAPGLSAATYAASTPTQDRWGGTIATNEWPVGRHGAAAGFVVPAIDDTEPRRVASRVAPGDDRRPGAGSGDSNAAHGAARPTSSSTEQRSTASRAVGVSGTRWSDRPKSKASAPTARSMRSIGSPFIDVAPWWPEPPDVTQPGPNLVRPDDGAVPGAAPLPRSQADGSGVARTSRAAPSLRSSGTDAGSTLEAIGLALDATADLRGVAR